MTLSLRTARRAGFTLVELVAAIALMLVLAALATGVVSSGAVNSQQVVQSADKVSGWLITAKNRAKRDGRPRGVRFYRNATDNNIVTEAQYIEVPDPLTITGQIAFVYEQDTSGGPNNGTISKRWAYFVPDDPIKDLGVFDSNVQNNDMLYLPEFGTSYRLSITPPSMPPNAGAAAVANGFPQATVQVGSTPVAGYNARLLTLATYPDLGARFTNPVNNPPTACYSTRAFGFDYQQSPRPLFGEPVMQLGSAAVIDARPDDPAAPVTTPTTNPSTLLGVTPAASTMKDFDIMFAPSGQVLGQSSGLIGLWVRNPTSGNGPYDFANAGEQVLVVAYTKTGAVSTQPVNQDPQDPFKNAKDGINAGF